MVFSRKKSEMWFRTSGVLRLFSLSDAHQVIQEVGQASLELGGVI